jgi:hypothetical protein
VIGWVLADINKRQLRETLQGLPPHIQSDLAKQIDQIMYLLWDGRKAWANVRIIESRQDVFMSPDAPGAAGYSPSASSYRYAGTNVSDEKVEGKGEETDEYGIGVITHRTPIRFSFEIKYPRAVVDRYRDLKNALKWFEAAARNPYIDAETFVQLSRYDLQAQEEFQDLLDALTNSSQSPPPPPTQAPPPGAKLPQPPQQGPIPPGQGDGKGGGTSGSGGRVAGKPAQPGGGPGGGGGGGDVDWVDDVVWQCITPGPEWSTFHEICLRAHARNARLNSIDVFGALKSLAGKGKVILSFGDSDKIRLARRL